MNIRPAYLTIACMLLVLIAPIAAQTRYHESATVLIEVPGASGTYPVAVNSEGDITGFDLGIPSSGFLRICNQDCDKDNYNPIVKINVPGARFTTPTSINDKRTITGSYDGFRGFVRECVGADGEGKCSGDDGSYTTFAPPHASSTFPQSINSEGDITGWYMKSAALSHGFLRVCGKSAQGYCEYKTFDPAPLPNVTMPWSINLNGAITGEYGVPGEAFHGFVRQPNGTFQSIDVPGYIQTESFSINAKGEIAGICYDVAFENVSAFLREPDGRITTFEVPGAFVTYASSINDFGTIAGFYYYLYPSSIAGGFIRAPDGTITLFGVPDNSPYLVRVNNSGAVVGMYRDLKFRGHGFLRLPRSDTGSLAGSE